MLSGRSSTVLLKSAGNAKRLFVPMGVKLTPEVLGPATRVLSCTMKRAGEV